MNTEKLDALASQAGFNVERLRAPYPGGFPRDDMLALESFAELIVRECDRLNRTQSLELAGVVADVEQGPGFDSVCLDTVKRVESYLSDSTLKKHFGVEE